MQWFISACAGVLLAVACAGLSIWGLESGIIFLPAAFLAGVLFPQGIHGDSPALFMLLAFILTAAMFTPFIFLAQHWWLRRKQAKETSISLN
jgi:hypothetical protein